MNYRISRIVDFFRSDIVLGIKNLIRWFPIIWNDRDWDWYHFAALMERKANQMADYLSKHGHDEESDDIAAQLRQVAKDLRFLIDDEPPEKTWEREDMDEVRGILSTHEENMAAAQRRVGIAISTKLRRWWD